MKKIMYKTWLSIEFVILFFGIPIYMFFYSEIIHPSTILLPIVLVLTLYLRTQANFEFKQLVKMNVSKRYIIKHLSYIGFAGLFLVLGVYFFDRENLFNLPKRNKVIWLMLSLLYPIFSAYLQEIIFRTFFFCRYKALFKEKWILISGSALAFGFVHILYYSHLSLILSTIAGFYLAYVYEKTKSLLFVTILHGFLGNLVFTVGLGHYFWLDMFKWL